jgi:hypothetical protein
MMGLSHSHIVLTGDPVGTTQRCVTFLPGIRTIKNSADSALFTRATAEVGREFIAIN